MQHTRLFFLLFLLVFAHCTNTFAQQDTVPAEEYYDEEEAFQDEEVYTDEYEEQPASRKLELTPVQLPVAYKDRKIKPATWNNLIRDEAFQYEEEETKQTANNSLGWWGKFVLALLGFFASAAGKIIIWLTVALLAIIIIFRIIKLNGNIFFARKDKKFGTAATDTADDYIPANWEQTIMEAAQAGNYRLAVRHGYRYLLFLLQEKELIQYQTAKTNYQYAYELAGTNLHKPFLQLTREYEYAWYGGFAIEKEQFEQYYQLVSKMKNNLS